MLLDVLEAWTAFMFHLGLALWNQVTLRSHRVSCKQCAQPLVAWYRTEAQLKGTPEEFLLLRRRLTGHVTFWKENKKTLPSEDNGNIFFERHSSGAAWSHWPAAADTARLDDWFHGAQLLLPVLSQGQKGSIKNLRSWLETLPTLKYCEASQSLVYIF